MKLNEVCSSYLRGFFTSKEKQVKTSFTYTPARTERYAVSLGAKGLKTLACLNKTNRRFYKHS